MKTIFFVWAGLCLSIAVEAANINEGNWEVEGSANLSSYSPEGTSKRYNSLSVGAGLQYFLADHFSAGMNFTFFKPSGSRSFYSASPVVTKYFLVGEKVAPYVSLNPIGISKSAGVKEDFYSSARLGTKFFLTDSISVGPALEYTKNWSGGDSLRLLGLFSLHL